MKNLNIFFYKPIIKCFDISVSQENFKEKLFDLIDVNHSGLIDKISFWDRFDRKGKKYIGTIGESLFHIKPRFIVGDFGTYASAILKGEFESNQLNTKVKITIDYTKSAKQEIRQFVILPLIIIILIIINGGIQEDLYAQLGIVGLALVILGFIILNMLVRRKATTVFVKEFSNLFKKDQIKETTSW